MRGWIAVGIASALMGCASARSNKAIPADTTTRPALTGIWEGLSRATLTHGSGAGDTRVERHAWQLQQHGARVSGFYVVELTMVSGDGRPYVCSRSPEFSTLLRFELRGVVAPNGGAVLEEVGSMRAQGPCEPARRPPHRYLARLQGNVLTLTDGSRRQTLYRRAADAAGGQSLAQIRFEGTETPGDGLGTGDAAVSRERPGEPDLSSRMSDPSSRMSHPLSNGLRATPPGGSGRRNPHLPGADEADDGSDIQGYWVWENRGMLPTGDEKFEREEWHLSQDGALLTGYYDRSIRQVSLDGMAYRCNGALDFEIVTRYQVAGEIQGDKLVLREQAYEILEGSPCDDGRRRLDAYQGHVTTDEIRLMWGVGQQVLRRGRPDVPTQRF